MPLQNKNRALYFCVVAAMLSGCVDTPDLFRTTPVAPQTEDISPTPAAPDGAAVSTVGITAPVEAGHDTFTQLFEAPKHDFLFVVDNSKSMKDKIERVKDNITTFAMQLWSRRAETDFRISVVVTDYLAYRGQLLAIGAPGPLKYFVDGSSPDFSSDMRLLLDKVPFGVGATQSYEMGLISAKAAIEKYAALFMRDDAGLHVVLFSDEQDYSCDPDNVPAGGVCRLLPNSKQPENMSNWSYVPVVDLISFFKSIKEGAQRLNFFPIVGLNKTDRGVITTGQRYIDVAAGLPHAQTRSIADDIATSLGQIALEVGGLGTCFSLSSLPDIDSPIEVSLNNIKQPDGWWYESDGNKACFPPDAIPPNGSQIEVFYTKL